MWRSPMVPPSPPCPPSPPERTALSRELADFLIELSIALHKHAMYPEGHPSIAPAAAGGTRRAQQVLEGRPSPLPCGGRQQLVIERGATHPQQPPPPVPPRPLHSHPFGARSFPLR